MDASAYAALTAGATQPILLSELPLLRFNSVLEIFEYSRPPNELGGDAVGGASAITLAHV
jgi:hypothetical protein